MNKLLRGACVAFGLALFGASVYLYNNFTNQPETIFVADNNYNIENSDDSSGSAKMVMVKGLLNPAEPALDTQLNVKANYIILQRQVQLYQFFMEGDKPMMGWKDHPIKSFKDKQGREYKNPAFPTDIKPQTFYAKLRINDGSLPIDYRFIQKDLDWKKYEKNFYYLSTLPEQSTPSGFTYKKSHYLKPGKNPKSQIGSVRIFYKVFNHKELPELTIIGQQTKRMLSRTNSDCRFYDSPIEMSTIKKTYNQDAFHAALGTAFFGTFFILLGIFKGKA